VCGRYSLGRDADELVEVFDVPGGLEIPLELPRWNIAPTQEAPSLLRGSGGLRLGPLRWGLVPFWADDPSIGNRLINARSESVDRRPAFREAFPRRRCLIPADGFYEWQRPASGRGPKTPFWIHPADGSLMTFAGLWERWRPASGPPLFTFTILTTGANAWMRTIHDRMPVIVAPGERDRWLDRDASPGDLQDLLVPPPEELLVSREVSTRVNRPENDDPACVEPVGSFPPGGASV
jgi:putative SOS response-associated peptidase YedK